MRHKVLKEAEKLWDLVGAKFDVKFSFGAGTVPVDPVQSFPGPPNMNSDHDYSDRVVYRVGAQVCVHDVESGEKFFLKSRPISCASIIHVAIDSKNQFFSVCEEGTASEEDENAFAQLSVYSMKGTYECCATLNYPSKFQFLGSVFANGNASKHVVALLGGHQHEIIVWNWQTRKIIKHIPIPDASDRIRCAPSQHNLMVTCSGKHGLKVWYSAGESTGNVTLLNASLEVSESVLDHVWMPSGNGINKMVALSCSIDANVGHGKHQAIRRQYLNIFEGRDQVSTKDKTGTSKGPMGAPILLECRQTICLKLNNVDEIEQYSCVTSTQKGFCIASTFGQVSFYERTDDKREPYIEVRSISLDNEHDIRGINLLPSEGLVAAITASGRVLSIPSEMNIRPASTDDDNEDKEKLIGSDVSDLAFGGNHAGAITEAAMAKERSIIATLCPHDNTLRVWNYETKKCEVSHDFGSDEPLSVTMHENGMFLVVALKDRLRGYNIGMASLKPYKEVIQKGCKQIVYSHSGAYIAASSGINLIVFDAVTFKKIMTFQGHMMPIKRICWSRGDQFIFSAGVDGSVIGWPIAKQGRIDVVASNPRASTIVGLEVDAESMNCFASSCRIGRRGPDFPPRRRQASYSSYDGWQY